MYRTKFLGGLCFCLRWGGGGSLGTLTRYYNYLFMYVVSSRILAFWCCFVLTHTQQSRVSAGPGFFRTSSCQPVRSYTNQQFHYCVRVAVWVMAYFKHAEIYAWQKARLKLVRNTLLIQPGQKKSERNCFLYDNVLMDCGFVVPRSLSSPRMYLFAEFRKNIQMQTKLLLDSFSDERSRK